MNIACQLFRSYFSVTFILIVFATSVFAQEETSPERPWRNGAPFSIDGKELVKSLKDYPSNDESNFDYLLVDYRIEFFDDGRMQRKFHLIYKILTRDGVQNSSIDRSWSPWFENKPTIEARVISRRGFVSKLDQSTLAEAAIDKLDDLVLSSDKRVQAPLPSTNVGSIVETLTTDEQSQPFCEHGYYSAVYGASAYGADCWRLTVVAPENMELTFNQIGIELDPEIKQKEGKTTWTFSQTDVDYNSDLFSYLPSNETNHPQIQVSSGSSWQDFASYYADIVQKQIAKSKLKNPITADLSEATTEEKIQHAMELLHDRVRYTGLHFGSMAIVPKPPELTWKNGFGDCKDKSVLLLELLRRLNIRAQIALLKASGNPDVSPDAPAINVFDHAIVYLPDLDLWIDPTAEWMPLGNLPQSDQNRWALIAQPKTTKLIKTPLLESSTNYLDVDWSIDLREGEPALLTRVVKADGGIGTSYRDHYSSESKSRIKESWFEQIKRVHESKKLVEFDFSDPYDLTVPITSRTTFEGSVSAVVKEEEAEYLLEPGAVLSRIPASFFLEEEESTEDPAPRRTSDFHMSNRHRMKACYTITGPMGFHLKQLPKSQKAKVRDLVFNVDFEKVSPRCCKATFEFNTGKGVLTADEFYEFKKKIIAIVGDRNTDWKYSIAFTNRSTSLSRSGNYGEAVQLLKKHLEVHPEDPFLKMQLAYVMLDMGLGDAARRTAKLAVEALPQSSYLQHRLGRLMTHDLLGRNWEYGYDFAAAESAYKKSIEADPENPIAAFDLAILYEHGPLANRYADLEQLEKAIEIYQQRQSEDDYRLFHNYLLCLTYAQKFEEVLDALETVNDSRDYDFVRTMALAVVKGADEAIAHVRTVTTKETEIAEFVQRCSLNLKTMEQLDAAIALYENDSWVSEIWDPKGHIEICKYLKTATYDPFQDDDPRKAVLELLIWVLTDANDLNELAKSAIIPSEDEAFKKFMAVDIPRDLRNLKLQHLGQRARIEKLSTQLKFDVQTIDQFAWVSTPRRKNQTVFGNFIGDRKFLVFLDQGTWKVVSTTQGDDEIFLRCHELLSSNPPQKKIALKLLRRALKSKNSNRSFFDSIPPFPKAFRKVDRDDVEQLKFVAALLSHSDEAMKFVESKLEQLDKFQKIQALTHLTQHANALGKTGSVTIDHARKLDELESTMDTRIQLALALLHDHEFQQAEEIADLLMESSLKAFAPFELKIWALQGQGKFEQVSEMLVKHGTKRKPQTANNYAWNSLFLEKIPDDVLKTLSRAAEKSNVPNLYHTYATLLAHQGKSQQAKLALIATLQRRPYSAIEPVDYYVLGLIAENEGLTEEAKFYFGEASKLKSSRPVSAVVLAKKRLDLLDKTPVPTTPQ